MFLLQTIANDPITLRLLFSLIILIIMLIAKRFLSRWVINGLSHIHFYKVRLELSALSVLQKPINYLILTSGIFLALVASPLVYFKNSIKQSFFIGDLEFTINILSFDSIKTIYIAIVIGIVTWIIYKLEHLYEQFFTELNEKLSLIDNTVFIRYLSRIINFITLAFGFAIMLTILIPDLDKLMTGVGIGGAAFALIAKDSLAGIFSGMFLLLDKPFAINDWVSIDQIEGIIEDISFRSTRIRTFTQGLVIVPNNTINNANITNWSRMEKRRVSFELGVSYNTTPEQIQFCIGQIKKILSTFNEIEQDTSLVHFTNFGDYSLNIQIIYYTYATDLATYSKVKEQVNLQILDVCNQNQIEIAFPTQTILLPQQP